jgi:hypothetical protein
LREFPFGVGDDELKRRTWGCVLSRCLAARRPTRCAPRCRAGALFLRLRSLPVGDGALVGGLGLACELQINNACNGVKLSEVDRQKLYRLRHQPDESETEREEAAAA